MKKVTHLIPASMLILLYVYAVSSKLAAFGQFREQLKAQPFSETLASVLVYLIPGSEAIVVLLICTRRFFLTGLYFSLCLLALFTVYIGLAITGFWKDTPCSCGGVLSHMPWGAHLIFNCLFLLLNLVAIYIHHRERRDVTKMS